MRFDVLYLSGGTTYCCFTCRACERGFLQSNKVSTVLLPTSQFIPPPIPYSSSELQLKKHSVNCPLQQCFTSCSQAKILHIDSRLLAQFSPWKRSCSGHSLGCFVRSNLTPKSSHITMYVNSPVPSLSPSLCYRSLGVRLLHQYNTQVKQKSIY